MSRTYSIGCKKCLESLWIGQGWPKARRYIYKLERNIQALERFLFDHEGHELIFCDNEDIFSGEGIQYDEEEYLTKGSLVETELAKGEVIKATGYYNVPIFHLNMGPVEEIKSVYINGKLFNQVISTDRICDGSIRNGFEKRK